MTLVSTDLEAALTVNFWALYTTLGTTLDSPNQLCLLQGRCSGLSCVPPIL